MANPKIEVEIGAKTQGLRSGVNLAEKELNNLGRAAQQTSPKVNNLSQSISGANGVGIEFSRIIQDAPFGIIGVGNNITQLAGSFSNLQKQTGSASQALKIAFQSIISPANLLVLGISAVTTALTLYSMNARKTKEEIDGLKAAQDSYNDSLKETDRLLGREVFAQFLKEVGLIEQQNIGGRLIDVPTFQNAAQVVDLLSGKIENLRKGELDLLAKFLQTEIAEATRTAANNAGTFAEQLATQDIALYNGVLEKVNTQLAFYKNETAKSTKATEDLQTAINSFSTQPLVDAYFEAVKQGNAFRRSLESAASGLTGQEGDVAFGDDQFGIQATLNQSGPPIEEIADTFVSNLERIQFKANELGQAFSGLGALIGKAFNNTGLGQFVGEFLRFASQLVAANFKISTANAITSATSSAAATGPGAIFTLPAFIAGAIGLVASAFAAIGGGSKSSIGSSGVGGASAQTFAGSGAGLDLNRSLALTGEFKINGRDLVYVIDESRSQNASG